MAGDRVRVLSVIGSSIIGGAERGLVSLLETLGSARFDLSIACPGEGPMLDEYRRVAGEVRCFDLRPVPRVTAVRELARWMRASRADVVHTHLWTADLNGGLAAAVAGVPARVASVHGSYFRSADVSGVGRMRRRAASRVFRSVYVLFDRVIAASQATAADLVDRPGVRVPRGKITVIGCGVDPVVVRQAGAECGAAELPAGRPLVVCVANLVAIKGHEVLLRAMCRLLASYPAAHLLLLGDGPRRSSIEALIARLGLERNVTLAGARPDALRFTAAADVVVLSSHSEGTPRALVEALCLGKAVVATAVGGVPELVLDQRTGWLVPPSDPAALAAAVAEVLSRPVRAAQVARRGPAHVAEHFSVSATAARIEDLYRALLTAGS